MKQIYFIMNQLFKSFIFFLLLSISLNNTKSIAQNQTNEPEFATIVFWSTGTMFNHSYNTSINSLKAFSINNYQICYFKVYSRGELLISSEFYTSSGSTNLEVKNNDTLYVKLSLIPFVNQVDVQQLKKEDFLKFTSRNKNIPSIKASENLNFPYNPGSFTSAKPKEKSGTGFLISDKGYIVTNHHVIDNADKITISGVNGNFNSELSAKVVLKDEASDLALLKIEDRILIDPIPYVIVPEQISIGENVFLLGFPYIKTMGTDVKLTNGIVSSKSGYEGNINSYQVSAPVQPGNSGGPVFDANGRIIAIVNAKHTLAENASYAIKSKYLLDLLENLDEKVELNKTNQLEGLTLPQQVEKAQQFVVIIKTK